jgi:DNA-binding NarL/FixJ family response regulator
MKYEVGIVDDHQLFLKSLTMMLDSFPDFEVTVEALDGSDLMAQIVNMPRVPDIILIDVNMPGMDGEATATWLSANYPQIRLAALSTTDTHNTIISMIKAGCCSYLLKNTHPTDLEKALLEIGSKGYYNADVLNFNLARYHESDKEDVAISPKELLFLPYVCTDLTYKEIAVKMGLSERTIDGYRESLFLKFNVRSRTGLAMIVVRRKLVDLSRLFP